MDVLPVTVAQALGTSRWAAAVALWGPRNLARQCARVIAALKAAGAEEALVRFIQPIDLAVLTAQPAIITSGELHGAFGHSRDETRFSAAPTREIVPAYLKRLYRLYQELDMGVASRGSA